MLDAACISNGKLFETGLLAFQKLAQVFSGKKIDIWTTMKTAFIEGCYYVAFVTILSILMLILFALVEFWPRLTS